MTTTTNRETSGAAAWTMGQVVDWLATRGMVLALAGLAVGLLAQCGGR